MRSAIDIDIQLDPKCSDPKIVIRTDRVTPEIDAIIHAIEDCTGGTYPTLTAYSGDAMVLLNQREVIRVYVENRRLIVRTERGDFVVRKTLAEMEELLDADRFLRISRSEVINLRKVSKFDFSLTGTIHVHFDDGSSTWVARRYVRAIQEKLDRM